MKEMTLEEALSHYKHAMRPFSIEQLSRVVSFDGEFLLNGGLRDSRNCRCPMVHALGFSGPEPDSRWERCLIEFGDKKANPGGLFNDTLIRIGIEDNGSDLIREATTEVLLEKMKWIEQQLHEGRLHLAEAESLIQTGEVPGVEVSKHIIQTFGILSTVMQWAKLPREKVFPRQS